MRRFVGGTDGAYGFVLVHRTIWVDTNEHSQTVRYPTGAPGGNFRPSLAETTPLQTLAFLREMHTQALDIHVSEGAMPTHYFGQRAICSDSLRRCQGCHRV